jgi:hypothetical protein
MVPAKLGVCALERRVTVSLWLFDPVRKKGRNQQGSFKVKYYFVCPVPRLEEEGKPVEMTRTKLSITACPNPRSEEKRMLAYPFLWAFLLWLCCDEFFDSGGSRSLLANRPWDLEEIFITKART